MEAQSITERSLILPSELKTSRPSVAMTLFLASVGAGVVVGAARLLHLSIGWQVFSGTLAFVVVAGSYQAFGGGKASKEKLEVDQGKVVEIPTADPPRPRAGSAPSVFPVWTNTLPPSPSGSTTQSPTGSGTHSPGSVGSNEDNGWQTIPGDYNFEPIVVAGSFEEIPKHIREEWNQQSVDSEADERALTGIAFKRHSAQLKLTLLLEGEDRGSLQAILNSDADVLGQLEQFRDYLTDVDAISALDDLCKLLRQPDDGIRARNSRLEMEQRDNLVLRVLEQKGLERIDVVGDGDCLFRSLEIASGVETLRQHVADELSKPEVWRELGDYIRQDIRQSRDGLAGYPAYIKSAYEKDKEVYLQSEQFQHDYCTAIRTPKLMWGSGVELQHILPNILGKNIVVYSGQTLEGYAQFDSATGETEEKVTIFFWASGNHYNALIPISN